MAEQLYIPAEMLHSGDLVDVEYLVKYPNDLLLDHVLGRIKVELSTDARFNYQGSRMEEREEDSPLYGGIHIVHYFIVTVQVADPRKVVGNRNDQTAEALSVPVAILLGVIAASIAASVVAGSAAVIYNRYTITRIATDPTMSEETKQAALGAIEGSGTGIGGGLVAAGGSLVTAAIIVAVLWALSLSRQRGGAD
jgi:hypothetical protein